MAPEMIALCIAVIAIGVGVIAYVLLHAPKEAAHIGSPAEISLGEENFDDPADAPAEEAESATVATEEEEAEA